MADHNIFNKRPRSDNDKKAIIGDKSEGIDDFAINGCIIRLIGLSIGAVIKSKNSFTEWFGGNTQDNNTLIKIIPEQVLTNQFVIFITTTEAVIYSPNPIVLED
jgi:hypothetical protein